MNKPADQKPIRSINLRSKDELADYDQMTAALEAEYVDLPLDDDARKLIDDLVAEAGRRGKEAQRVAEEAGVGVSQEIKDLMQTEHMKSQRRRLEAETKLTIAYSSPQVERPENSLLEAV